MLDKDQIQLEKILERCEMADKTEFNKDVVCKYSQDPLDCPYRLFYNDICYCKFETILNPDKAEQFAKWMGE